MPIYYSGSSGSTTKDFHAIRRTQDGLLYYTKIRNAENVDIDLQKEYDPTYDLPVEEYVEEEISLREDTYLFTGNGSNKDFTLPIESDTDSTYVWLNGLQQEKDRDFTVNGLVVTFTIPPFDQAQVAIRLQSKEYFNNENDKYQQYRLEAGTIFYYSDDEGYLVKRFGGFDQSTVLSGDGADSYELYNGQALKNITSYKEDISTGFDQTNVTMDDSTVTMDAT